MTKVERFKVGSKAELRAKVRDYAARGYLIVQNSEDYVSLSKKKIFNWILAIILLFVPIIGWLALGAMIFAASRGSHTVEIELAAEQASA